MRLNFKDDSGRTILSLEIIGEEDSEGWLEALVHFEDGGFAAHFQISIMLNDLYAFYHQIKPFTDSLTGEARFSNIEDNVNLIFSTDGLGHIRITGTLRHPNNPYLKTDFVINSDQTFLPSLVTECNQILKHYQPK